MPRAIKTTKDKLPALKTQPASVSSKKRDDYLEIRLPKFRFQDSPLSSLWVILLVVFAFLLGMTTTKLQYLQQGGTTAKAVQGAQTAPNPGAITMDTVKGWAKDIRLDSGKFNDCVDKQSYKNAISKDLSAAIDASAEATPTFYINGTRIVGAVPYEQFKTALDDALAGNSSGEMADNFKVDNGHLPRLGKTSAPVTMVEFSDLQCPFCLQFFQTTFPQIKKDYIDTGKVQFYYRQLPLVQLHPMAMSYANASECANEQGKFWEMHDKIFTEQENEQG